MNYLYPTTFFEPVDRDQDGLYRIESGNVHIFPFQIPFMGEQVITMEQMMPGSQDWSINVWFTYQPYDGTIFRNIDNWDDFRMSPVSTTFSVWDEGVEPSLIQDGSQTLAPGVTYYLNIRNLQNQTNGYRLLFSF